MQTSTRRPTALALVLGLVFSLFVLVAAPALAVATEHCPGANESSAPSVPSDHGIVLDNDTTEGYSQELRNDTVLPAGTLVCVKGSTDATGIVEADGVKTLREILNNDHDVSHYMTYVMATVNLSTACEGTQPTATVTIDNKGIDGFEVTVTNGDEAPVVITETTSFNGITDSKLVAEWGDGKSAEVTFQDCSTPDDPEPSVELSTACDDTQAKATVTIDNDGDEEFSVEVFIDNVSQGTITETTTFDGSAESVLRAEWGEGESDEVTFEDCTEDGPLLSTASFTVGSECETFLPALTYDAIVSETADDPVGDITLTVSDASGELGQATFSASEAGSLTLPTELEGETVDVSWDFDGTVLEQTLASGCAAVQGLVDERDEEPAALPATEVKGEQLAAAGFKEDLLLLLGGGFLALGCSLLLYGRRRYGVTA